MTNSTAIHATAKYFDASAMELGNLNQSPTNVFFHIITTLAGIIALLSLLRRATNSSSASLTLIFIYLLSLLPVVPNGLFVGTLMFCILIVYLTRQLKLGFRGSVAFLLVGYVIQDLSRLGTGDRSFLSLYNTMESVSFSPSYNYFLLTDSVILG